MSVDATSTDNNRYVGPTSGSANALAAAIANPANWEATESFPFPTGGNDITNGTLGNNFTVGSTTGTIVIVKDTVPDAAQDFAFTTTGGLSPATFSLDDDAVGPLVNAQTFNNVAAGSYSVTETAVAGYTNTLSCVDPSGGTTTASATATIDLAPGETVTCTNTNTAQPGSIVIIENTAPDGPQDFAFTTTGGLSPATFDLDDDTDGALPNTQTFSNVAAGSYTVSETAVAGYTTTLSCTLTGGGMTGTTFPTATLTTTIDLGPGETATCTFTNSLPPTPVPEPKSLVYMLYGLAGLVLVLVVRRRLQQRS